MWLVFAVFWVLIGVGPFLPRLVPLEWWDYYCGPWETLPALLGAAFLLRASTIIFRNDRLGKEGVSLRLPILALLLSPTIAAILFKATGVVQTSDADYGDYVRLGKYLADSGFAGLMTLDVWRPPGMAFALALPLWVGLSANSAVWLINTISLLVSVMALLYLVAGSGIRKPTAVVLAVVMPPIAAVYMLMAMSEIPAFALQMVTLSLIPLRKTEIRNTAWWKWLAAGCCLALAVTFRPVIALQLLVLAYAAVISYVTGLSRVDGLRRASTAVCILVLGFVLTLAPWTIRNYIVLDGFLPLSYNGGEVFYAANYGSSFEEQGRYIISNYAKLRRDYPDPIVRNTEGFRQGLRAIASHPLVFAESIPFRSGHMLGGILAWPAMYVSTARAPLPESPLVFRFIAVVCLLCGWAILAMLYKKRHEIKMSYATPNSTLWPHLCLVIMAAANLLFECSPRYTITLMPYAITIVAFGLRAPKEQVAEVDQR